jgi:hypothetical protein
MALAGTGVALMNTRGFRNNNPGNLRFSGAFKWVGQIGSDSDGYLVFDSMENGVRAMVKTLHSYIYTDGVKTVAAIVSRWAPPGDNNPTTQYIANVSQALNVPPDQELSEADIPTLVAAIIRQENGGDLGVGVIAEGLRLAYIG